MVIKDLVEVASTLNQILTFLHSVRDSGEVNMRRGHFGNSVCERGRNNGRKWKTLKPLINSKVQQ